MWSRPEIKDGKGRYIPKIRAQAVCCEAVKIIGTANEHGISIMTLCKAIMHDFLQRSNIAFRHGNYLLLKMEIEMFSKLKNLRF
jgi:hypothetical protein